ncbi:MAG TPA: protein-L-isoaspartate O-methyltransferase [Candidatus Bathyarchaeia archaeon]|nr:protein-L-isoaspartate O-methyltransferase [Candidatus Bathyarchaeia archaeon]
MAESRRQAVDDLKTEGILRTPEIIRAMNKVPREEFLPADAKPYAYRDSPLPIGWGQTTSALHMTALFCEYGEMKLGQSVLEVGGGCGYMSCVYAEVVAPSEQKQETWGHVWTAEIVPELAEFGRENVERLGYSDRVTYLEADASDGLKGVGPFDLIIVTSAAPNIPSGLVEQVKVGGMLLIPVGAHFGQDLIRVRKNPDGKLSRENLGGVVFVPMKGKRGW